MRALKKYIEKAKEIKGDVIQTRLFDAEEVILDEDNKFVVLNGDVDYEFVTVQSTQVKNLKLNHLETSKFKEMLSGGVHAQKTVTTTVEIEK